MTVFNLKFKAQLTPLNGILLLVFFELFALTNLCGQEHIPCDKYVILQIDTVSLFYYNIIKASRQESENEIIKILSDKKSSNSQFENRIINLGDVYDLKLKPIYSIIERRYGQDSVWLSPSTMRIVTVNGETLISADYSIVPYYASNIHGLYIHKITCEEFQKK